MKIFLSLLAALIFSCSLIAKKPDIKILENGASAPDFNLPGVDGKNHKLDDYASSDVLAIVFTCNHCPTAQAYEERLIKMVDDYKGKSFQLIAISGNDDEALRLDEERFSDVGDSFEDMVYRAKDIGFNFPYLYDGDDQAVTIAYGAVATPHIFIFDKDRKLVYEGRIDSNENPVKVKKTETLDVINALLNGETIDVKSTRAFGCSTKWSYKRDSVKKKNEEWKKRPVQLESIDAKGVESIVHPSGHYRLINVWATWCAPCVDKFPKLIDVNRVYQNRNFQYITYSLDAIESKDKVHDFLKKQHAAMPHHSVDKFKGDKVSSNNYIFDGEDREDFFKALDPDWSGALPYLMIVSPAGEIVARWEGGVEIHELRKKLVSLMGRFSY